ncbi:hypothetical protein ACFFQ6_33780 [Rhodococcus baikonurensis]|uniref:Uncharacterized protein n=1 Tax=Rhodococcus baikonurensis TaxID=172041 RepID=A0ABV5XQB2_9NOCA
MTDFSLRAARIQLGALLAALALAIVIALGITTGAFVLPSPCNETSPGKH